MSPLRFLLVPLVAVAALAAPEAASQPVAVVVHEDVPVQNLSFGELRRIYRGDRQFWANRQRVTLLVRSEGAYERRVLLSRVYEMSERGFRQFWVGKIFRSEVATGPKVAYSNAMTLSLLRSLPGAIAFVRSDDVPAGTRVVRIDGLLPSDRGYPLR